MLIAPEIDRSTNRSIFNKLPTEGECDIQRLIKQVSALFREVAVEAALAKEPAQGQFGQGRASEPKKGGEAEVSKVSRDI